LVSAGAYGRIDVFLLDQLLRRIIRNGVLTVVDAGGVSHAYGTEGLPHVAIRLKDKSLHHKLFTNPELHAGEAYMNGTLVIEHGTLRDFLTLFAMNRETLRRHPMQKLVRGSMKKLKRWKQRNSEAASSANVRHHYDLSNNFYKLWLDSDMHYSCAYFAKPDDTLEQAQQNKLRHIAAKLDLKTGQRVLDIGCGWGGNALYLAKVADVEVLGITLSTEQHAFATERAKQRGLEKRVRFELIDYRQVQGPFDRIVSIGMFEHVGIQQFDTYFTKIRDLLTPNGLALVHSIGRKGGPGQTGAWVRRYIFPGGYSPALSETLAAVERAGLWTTDIEILRLHYARTLREWERRFQLHRADIAASKDERFCRMWEFYLIASELAFSHGKHMNFQLQLAKTVHAVPLTRDYMLDGERDLPADIF
jgi:cyclopropane-fatty-acyl-phospholipid synthase